MERALSYKTGYLICGQELAYLSHNERLHATYCGDEQETNTRNTPTTRAITGQRAMVKAPTDVPAQVIKYGVFHDQKIGFNRMSFKIYLRTAFAINKPVDSRTITHTPTIAMPMRIKRGFSSIRTS